MNIKKRVAKVKDEDVDRFRTIAAKVVNDEVISDDDNKKVISEISARDMAIGEEFTKNKHLLTGAVLGTMFSLALTAMYYENEKR